MNLGAVSEGPVFGLFKLTFLWASFQIHMHLQSNLERSHITFTHLLPGGIMLQNCGAVSATMTGVIDAVKIENTSNTAWFLHVVLL